MRIEFGKYAGKTLEEIVQADPGYLHWLVREQANPAELRAEAARLLELRDALGQPAGRRDLPAWLWSLFGGLAVFAAMVATRQLAAPATPPLAPTPIAALADRRVEAPGSQVATATPAVAVEISPTSTRVEPSPSPVVAGSATATPAMARAGQVPGQAPCGSRTVGAIGATQARDHVGESQMVEFQVVRAYNSGRAVFLNSHDPFQGYFAVVIFPERWPDFPEPPEKYFNRKCIAVRGRIERYQGAPEIILDNAEDIQIVE